MACRCREVATTSHFDELEDAFEIRDQTFLVSKSVLPKTERMRRPPPERGDDPSRGSVRRRGQRSLVFLNRGRPVYLGLYTMTEVPESPFCRPSYRSDDGISTSRSAQEEVAQLFQLCYRNDERGSRRLTDIQEAIAVMNRNHARETRLARALEVRLRSRVLAGSP